MMRLYDRATSGNSYKVRLLLALLGIEYQAIPVALVDGRNAVDAAYLALNPRGQVPTLDDNGFVLWGSTAILYYLASTYDRERRWLPADVQTIAQIAQWLELAQNEHATGLFLARAVLRFGYKGDLAMARRDGERALDVLEGRLANREWLAGEHATVADIACFPYAALAPEGGFDLAARPAVQRWIACMTRLPGFVGMPGIAAEHSARQ